MYDEEIMRTPVNIDDMWDMLLEHFDHLEGVLLRPVESREDALAQRYRKPNSFGRRQFISYRDADPELSQRDYFLKMGRSSADIPW